ncbi:MAG: hypothetical protein KDC24_15385, partial [Saprospiraceae bacterium]|nr:hypothetical protein [Saprospiraceae bacterium]
MKRNLLFLAIMLGWGVMVNSQSLFTEYYTLDSTFADNNVYGVSDLDADVWNNSIYLALNVRHKDFPTFDENFYHIVFSAFRKGQLEYDTIESYSRWYDRQTKVLLKMDANGDPWVFYKRATDDFNHVLFAWHRVEGTWQSFTLDYDVVVNPILVETSDNSLMVIYGADHDGITLTAATWNGNSWTFEPILNDQDRIWGFSHLSAVKNQDGTYFAVS